MKHLFLTVTLAILACFNAKADEGMWVMGNISAHTDSVLHTMGLELMSKQLYDADGPSLNNVVVMFGGFCSGAVVSNDGLVFTNHHCGFGSIQEHSSVKHDYLKNGFFAKSFKDELPNDGLYVSFHLRTIDVTDRILRNVPDSLDKRARAMAIDSIADALTAQVEDTVLNIYAEVNPFYKGSKYFLSVYQKYEDVRLVAAPPQCLGKYGGDTDNWMWPRQTCDFSVFRIYADKYNRPAKYSKDNRPYHPTNYARISLDGLKEGDYVMTLGYPGSTDRYLSSYGIESTMRNVNDVRYGVRSVKLEVMNQAMASSDALRIMYASKHASCSNYWKFSLGQNTALDNLKVLDEKRALEARIKSWAEAKNRTQYVTLLDSLKAEYEKYNDALHNRNLWSEALYSGSDIVKFVVNNLFGRVNGGKKSFRDVVEATYKDIDVATDKAMMKATLAYYLKHVKGQGYVPETITQSLDSIYGGNVDALVDALYDKSIFARPADLMKIENFSDIDDKDPMYQLGMSNLLILYSLRFENNIEEYERQLGDALREMNRDRDYYPDANFTLRLSYGLVSPINYGDTKNVTSQLEEARECITSPQSLINKYEQSRSGVAANVTADYELIDPVYKWLKKGKFSKKYIDPRTGRLPLCYLTTNDITGGNSGSGMYDGKGRLVGLAFDGNWEAMSGDIKFDTNLQRCIGVDVRYILSVLEDYLGAKCLVKEITVE